MFVDTEDTGGVVMYAVFEVFTVIYNTVPLQKKWFETVVVFNQDANVGQSVTVEGIGSTNPLLNVIDPAALLIKLLYEGYR